MHSTQDRLPLFLVQTWVFWHSPSNTLQIIGGERGVEDWRREIGSVFPKILQRQAGSTGRGREGHKFWAGSCLRELVVSFVTLGCSYSHWKPGSKPREGALPCPRGKTNIIDMFCRNKRPAFTSSGLQSYINVSGYHAHYHSLWDTVIYIFNMIPGDSHAVCSKNKLKQCFSNSSAHVKHFSKK